MNTTPCKTYWLAA